jgi:ribonuclease P protein component
MDETDLSAQRTEASKDPRFSQADVDEGRPGGDPVAPGEGTPSTVGVIAPLLHPRRRAPAVGPVRSRQTFNALRRSSDRGRAGPLTVTYSMQKSWSRSEVAYAISRQVGSAVVRNRLRRRLRSIMAEVGPSLPIGAYGIRAGHGAPELGFDELKVAMRRALDKVGNRAVMAQTAQETLK